MALGVRDSSQKENGLDASSDGGIEPQQSSDAYLVPNSQGPEESFHHRPQDEPEDGEAASVFRTFAEEIKYYRDHYSLDELLSKCINVIDGFGCDDTARASASNEDNDNYACLPCGLGMDPRDLGHSNVSSEQTSIMEHHDDAAATQPEPAFYQGYNGPAASGITMRSIKARDASDVETPPLTDAGSVSQATQSSADGQEACGSSSSSSSAANPILKPCSDPSRRTWDQRRSALLERIRRKESAANGAVITTDSSKDVITSITLGDGQSSKQNGYDSIASGSPAASTATSSRWRVTGKKNPCFLYRRTAVSPRHDIEMTSVDELPCRSAVHCEPIGRSPITAAAASVVPRLPVRAHCKRQDRGAAASASSLSPDPAEHSRGV